ncbi:MAG: GWxTD domain-containing protein [Candidatus Krumholzibacteria bacterium]|nr:GWxTD domain-containing protein [Candidatus Krumholzibacteria bacterium]
MASPYARYVTAVVVLGLAAAAASFLSANEYKVFNEEALFNRLHHKEKIRYNGLQYLLNDHQKKQYLSLETWDERDEWLRRFWLELDPTPTTRRNERMKEHFDRVKLVADKYGCEDPPGWDDRGEILIRYGQPDSIKRVLAEINRLEPLIPGEIWYYWSLRMLVTFTDPHLTGRYIHTTEAAGYEPWTDDYNEANYFKSSRMMLEDLAGSYDPNNPTRRSNVINKFLPMHIDPDLTDPRNALNPGAIDHVYYWSVPRDALLDITFRNLTDEYVKADRALYEFHHQIQRTRFIHYPGYTLDMQAYFDITTFRADNEKLRIEINFEIPVSEVTFDTTGGRLEAEVELRVKVWDMAYNEIVEKEERVRISVPNMRNAMVPAYLPGQVLLTLEPGYYRFGLETVDINSGARGVFKSTRRLTDGPDLSLSDIQFARNIHESDEDSRYRKGSIIVIPYPLHLYLKPVPITFYFEIYGLDTDKEDFGSYKVEYSVAPEEKKRWGPVYVDQETGISAGFKASGFGSQHPMRLEINTDNLWSGRFVLRVKVTDRRTRKSTEQTASFAILD